MTNLNTPGSFSKVYILISPLIEFFSSHQNIVKAASQRKKDEQEFEAPNLCAVISCCEIGCGYKSPEYLTKEYK